MARATLIEINKLVSPHTLVAGQLLLVDNIHIAVANLQVNITINIAQRLLVLVEGESARAYPITVGMRSWPTPVGAFTIMSQETDPVWDVPVSIQREMAQQGKRHCGNAVAEPWMSRACPDPFPVGLRHEMSGAPE